MSDLPERIDQALSSGYRLFSEVEELLREAAAEIRGHAQRGGYKGSYKVGGLPPPDELAGSAATLSAAIRSFEAALRAAYRGPN